MSFKNILSANYRDRGAKKRWLLRGFKEEPELAREHAALVATDVIFGPSTDYEVGFGCSKVAKCKEVTRYRKSTPPKAATRLRFNGLDFYVDGGSGRPVQRCKQLILLADGSMYAILNNGAKSKRAEKAAV